MANRYWAAGVSGNWNNTASWSSSATGTPAGASVPGSSDAAIFNAASGTVTATLDISPTVQTLTCTGFTGTLAFGTNTISLNSTGTVFTGATTMAVTGTPLIICTDSSATARTISPGTVTEANSISFNITAGTGTVTLTTNHSFKNVNYTGFTGIWGSGSPVLFGNLTLDPLMSVTAGGTVFFQSTSGTKTITTNAVVVDKSFTFNGVGGTWQLQDALTSGATRTCTLTAGTLDLNGYTLTTGLFSSSTTSTRVLAFGTGNITITGTSGTVFSGPNAANTGLTTTGTAQVNVTGNGTTTRIISPGNPAAITGFISFTVSAGSDTISHGAGQTFNNLTFTSGFTGTFANVARAIFGNLTLDANTNLALGTSITTFNGTGSRTITTAGETFDFPVTFNGVGGTFALQDALTLGSTRALTFTNGTLQLKAGTTSTVGSFVTTGTTLKYLQSTTPGTQATISDASGTDSVTYLSVQDSNATGGATWDATDPTNVNAGNNTGWSFSILAALSGLLATGSVGSLIYTVPVSLSGTQATGAVQTIFGFGWGAIPDTSESWGAIPNTSETWTDISDNATTWQVST